MPFPKRVSDEDRALLREIALTRRYIGEIYRTLPSNKQLAREFGVSRGAIEQILAKELAAYDEEQARKLRLDSVSRETIRAENVASWPRESMECTPNACDEESN